MSQFISKAELGKWLDSLAASKRVLAPSRGPNGAMDFRQVKSAAETDLSSSGKTAFSAKDVFFPISETLFTVERKDGLLSMDPAIVRHETVIFGIRPCDALGISLLDRPFLNAPADSLYAQHRDKTALVGLGCAEAGPECFCPSAGTGPQDARHVDVMLIAVEGGYSVRAMTDKGNALLAGAKTEERNFQVPDPPKVGAVPTAGITEVARAVFDNPYWDRLADRCLHCNVCAYVCTACYCFDVRDYKAGSKVERVRCWESCQSAGFTRIAGGYDPRGKKGAKLRQRFYHKLLYYPEQFDGVIACTGCGRCVAACPVNIDIREVITDMQALVSAKAGEKASGAEVRRGSAS